MPTATPYEQLCESITAHHGRERTFEQGCQQLASQFFDAVVQLGFPVENLRWVAWGDRSLDSPALHLSRAMKVLQEEGCDGATLRVGVAPRTASPMFFWPELRLRHENTGFTLVIADRKFVGPSADVVAKDGAGYFMQYIREMFDQLPAKWLRETHPAPSKAPVGFARSSP